MSDIDILVPGIAARDALRIMSQLGYQLVYPATEALIPVFGKDFVCKKSGGFVPVEVHWTIRLAEGTNSMDEDELWKNARSTRIGKQGIDAMTLSQEDFLLHLCLHASYQHEFDFGLRALYDITIFIERFEREIDWSLLCEKVLRHHWQKGVYLIFHLASVHTSAAVPVEVLTVLKPVDLPVEVVEQVERWLFEAGVGTAGMTVNTISFFKSEQISYRIAVLWRRFSPAGKRWRTCIRSHQDP